MSQIVTRSGRFSWTAKSEEAASLTAQDLLDDEAIAVKIGISRRTLARWKVDAEFAARVESHVAAFAAAVRSRGIARLENRVDALNDRWRLMKRVIAERGADPNVAGVAGGTTGLILRSERPARDGTVIEFAVDTGLLTELRAHEQQAAKELGQWEDRIRSTVRDGRPDLSRLSDAELDDYERLTSKASAGAADE